jgi:GNAT superfamily N-acetyltransferase
MAASTAVSTSIRLLDPASDADIDDVATLLNAYWREVLGDDEPDHPAAEVRDGLRLDRPDIDHTIVLAKDERGSTIGFASVDIRVGHGNEHMAWIEDLYVAQSHRRRGAGRALFDAVVDRARSAGRTLVLGGHHDGGDAGAAFAAAMGATPGHRERQNRALTADLDRELLQRWIADAASNATGYSLVTYDDHCPEDILESVVRAAAAMNDAPHTELLDDFLVTREHVRATEKELAAAGISSWYVGVRHDATGEIAGFTELSWRPDKAWFAEQGDTGVVAAHRGHGIGRWVKAVNALRLLEERPEVRVIETWNDGSNQWMLAINDAMGFRPVATWIEDELPLA